MKIVTDKRIPGLEEGLRRLWPEALIVSKEGGEIGREDVIDADALIVRTRTRIDSALLQGSSVRLVATATIGTDHIDTHWCEANGIKVANAPGSNAPAVMQYAACSLAAAGFDPGVHTLGVVGKGNIGSLLCNLYRDAGAKVLVCDPPRKDAGFSDEDYLPLEELISKVDAISFHVPYTFTGNYPTHHLLRGELPGSLGIIVNSSRGSVVETSLIDDSRRFIIDTWPFEDRPSDYTPETRSRLIRSAFIATPHIAGYSAEGKRRATEAMLRALEMEFGTSDSTDHTPLGESPTISFRYDLEEVIKSFNPLDISERLKNNPENFEAFRAAYLRPEPAPLNIH